MAKRYGVWHAILDMCLIFLTGGLWLLWMIVRLIRSSIKR